MASLSNGFLEAGLLYPREWCREDTAATYTCMVLGFRGLAEVGYKQCNSFFRAKDWDQLEGVTETLVAPNTGGVDGDYGYGEGGCMLRGREMVVRQLSCVRVPCEK